MHDSYQYRPEDFSRSCANKSAVFCKLSALIKLNGGWFGEVMNWKDKHSRVLCQMERMDGSFVAAIGTGGNSWID